MINDHALIGVPGSRQPHRLVKGFCVNNGHHMRLALDPPRFHIEVLFIGCTHRGPPLPSFRVLIILYLYNPPARLRRITSVRDKTLDSPDKPS